MKLLPQEQRMSNIHLKRKLLISSKTPLLDLNKYFHYKIPYIFIPFYDFICRAIVIFISPKNRHNTLVKLLYLVRFKIYFWFIIYAISIYSQKLHLLKNRLQIETLIYGSSHGLLGYKEAPNKECNLSIPSCDLYYMLNLFYCSHPLCSKLKRIILFVSPFHGGYCVQRSYNATIISPLMKTIWDINYNSNGKVTAGTLEQQKEFKSFLNLKKEKLDFFQEEVWELYNKIIFPSRYSLTGDKLSKIRKEFYKSHSSFIQNCSKRTEVSYLFHIISCAHKLQLKTYIVLPPYTREYLEGLPSCSLFKQFPVMFENNTNISVLDFSSDPDFSNSDFADLDHLTPIGAQKLTLKIHNAIRQTEGINYP